MFGTSRKKKNKNLGFRFRFILLSFLAVILVGCVLLMLPVSTKGPGGAPLGTALFTATSATCVTGLVVQDTATYWSVFGQAVILLLIQIGGMGVVTVAIAAAVISGRRIGLLQRSTMQEAIAAPNLGGIVRLTSFLLRLILAIEAVGVLAMAPAFCRDFGIGRGIWYAVFHAVSAFCNAGFDLMGVREPFSSLTAYTANPWINVTVMLLILIGGIGFLTWDDIRQNGIHLKRYRMQSKVILTMTGILLVLPTLYFYFYEFGRADWSHLSGSERVWSALFQAVTPRTAGFNTVPLASLSETGIAVTILLMLTGGAPGSTAGGAKMTTVAVLYLTLFSVVRKKENANCFGRRIPDETVKYAVATLILYLTLMLGGGILISCIEGLPLLACLFETTSAICTVGLTVGITPQLGMLSRAILIALMYIGRVGGMTVVFAALSNKPTNVSKLPQEKITVG